MKIRAPADVCFIFVLLRSSENADAGVRKRVMRTADGWRLWWKESPLNMTDYFFLKEEGAPEGRELTAFPGISYWHNYKCVFFFLVLL